jgi:hypothetical protein
MDTIKCRRCGTENPAWRSDCENCKSNLRDLFQSSPYQKKEPHFSPWVVLLVLGGIAVFVSIYSAPLHIIGYSTPKAVEEVRACYTISGTLVVDPNSGTYDLAAMEESKEDFARMVIRNEVSRISSDKYEPTENELFLDSQEAYTVAYPVVLVKKVFPGVWKVSCKWRAAP